MSNFKFSSVSKICKDVNFVSKNAISSDVLCTICKEILIDAHSAPCGCRYCLECIITYLTGEDRYCPGNMEDCKIELLNINNNIHIDHPMNIKISRLIVKCPVGECDGRVEMRKLEDHIRVCKWRPTNCPFHNVGCGNVQMPNNAIEQHLLSDNYAHMKLLVDSFDVLKNDFGQVKEEVRDIAKVKAEIRELKTEVSEIKAEIKEMRNEGKEIKASVAEMSREVGILRDKIEGKKTVIIGAVILLIAVLSVARQSHELDLLHGEMVALGNVNREIIDTMNDLGSKIKRYEAANLETRNNGEIQMNEIKQLKQMETDTNVKLDRLEEKMIAMISEQNQLKHFEYLWTIDNFSDKRQTAQNGTDIDIFSEAFFSHQYGYKMCLSVSPDGFEDTKGTHLGVYFHFMRGPFDDLLQWPFQQQVTLAIVNQQSGLNAVNDTLKYGVSVHKRYWERPTESRNDGIGFSDFVKLDELLTNGEWFRNDRIIINCTVHKF